MDKTRITAALLLLALLCADSVAADWPQWRGPNFNGSTDEANLPQELGPATMAWSIDLPGPSSATPIVLGDRIFVSSLDKPTGKFLALCVERATGKLLWRKEVGASSATSPRNNQVSPSPTADGKRAYFHYANGLLAAFDHDGNALWSRDICKDHGQFHYLFIYGSSPLLYKDKLYVQAIHRDQPYSRSKDDKPGASYLLAIDPATGTDVWKCPRITEARNESQEAYSTLVPVEGAGGGQILAVGGDHVTGHDPQTGKELWRCGGWNPTKVNHWRLIPSITVAGDLFIACAPKKGPVLAIRSGGSGLITQTHIAWQSKDGTSDCCTPLYYRGNLYVLDGDGKALACLDPATGKLKSSVKVDSAGLLRASPTGADGRIHCMSEDGEVLVYSADDLKLLSKAQLGSDSPSRSSVAAARGMLIVRTSNKLYAFARK